MAECLRIDTARLGSGSDEHGPFWYLAHDCWADDDLARRSRLVAVAFVPERIDEDAVVISAEGALVPEVARFRDRRRAEACCIEANESLAGDGWAREDIERALLER